MYSRKKQEVRSSKAYVGSDKIESQIQMKSGSCSDEYNRCTFVLQRKLSDTPVITKDSEILIGTVIALSVNLTDSLNGNFTRINVTEDSHHDDHADDLHTDTLDLDTYLDLTSEAGAFSSLVTASITIASLLLF